MQVKPLSHLENLTPYQPGKPIEELQRELGLTRISKLASNENPLGCSPNVSAALQKAASVLHRYPDGNAYYLKTALATFLGVEPEQILPGNGSNEVLELVARAFAGAGDEVIYDAHAFAVYPLSAQAVGATGVAVPSKAFAHDLKAMAAAITERTKLIYLANPNNPTGTLFGKAEFEHFMKKVPEHVVVVLDEAYYEYAQQVEDYPDGLDYLPHYSNLLVSRTFSKAYGLAGLRIGYLVGDAEIINYLNRLREPFNVNSLAQAAAIAAIEDQAFVFDSVALNHENMCWLMQALKVRELDFISSAGNFISVHFERAAAMHQALLEKGVIVRPLVGYRMPEWLRISIGTRGELQHLMDVLDEV